MSTGTARPSFKPLSTVRTSRTSAGTDLFATTGAPNAASVGARIVASTKANATPRAGNSRAATSGPQDERA